MLKPKGIEDFVAAARIINRAGPKARFVLVGEPDLDNPSSVMQSELETWQREGVIEWWGWRDDMQDVFSQSNLICLPSYYGEGLSRTLLEAAACGRACVASDIPGCRGIVRNNENGLLVPVRDIPALVAALTLLLEQPDLRRQMGLLGRQIVEQNFSEKNIIDQTLKLYPRDENVRHH
jgi:glycosyltransferase involved in cell wall biosynthesis